MADLLAELKQRKPVNLLADLQQQQAQQQIQSEVPTDENLAIPAPGRPDRSFGESLIGAGEAALTLLTGATGGAAAFAATAPDAVIGELTGQTETGEGLKKAQQAAANLTFEPRTEAGKEFVGDISGLLSVLPPILAAGPLGVIKPLVAGRAVTAKLLKSPRAKRALLAEEIRRGKPNIDRVTKALNDSGEIITRPASKRAVKVLGNDDIAKGTVSVLENMSTASKAQVNKMLNDIVRGSKDPIFRDANRPSDILGQSIANRARAVSKQNKIAGKAIGDAADALKDVNVDINVPKASFLNELNELGVTFISKGDDGWGTPDFSRSKFIGGSQKDMAVLINGILDGAPGFKVAHKLKQTIRDNVDFDKGGTGQIKGNSKRILKDLARGIDDVLDSASPKYKRANENFAKTIKLKDDFDKLAGKNIDIDSNLSAKALGGKGMRLDSNAESRVHIEQTLLRADEVLKEFGVKFRDDVPSLVHIVGKLNDAFKLTPGGSLKGNVIGAGLDVIEATTSPIAAVRLAARKLSGVKVKDFDKKIRAIRSIITKQDK